MRVVGVAEQSMQRLFSLSLQYNTLHALGTMIASNIAAFSNTAGRFHRNIVTIPQVADSDGLNPYTMLTRSQARRKSGEVQMAASPPAMHAAGRIFITNGTLKSSRRRSTQFHGMKQETMRQLK